MIKLIASDMDGTLLNEHSEVPPETFDLIMALREKGVHFAASSGRRYDTLCKFFAPVREYMDFVASNGAQVFVNGEVVDREVMSHASLLRLIEVVRRFDCLHVALSDRTHTFLYDDYDVYEREIDKDLPDAHRIYDELSPNVNILKASIYCDTSEYLMDMQYALSRELGDRFAFTPSGKKWIDANQLGVTKATGIAQVMRAHGIAREEVMAFGDAMNDYEILSFVGHSRAMGNARYAIKQIADKVIETNVEHGVQNEMRKVLKSLS